TAVVSTTAWPGPGSAPTTSVGLPGPSTSTPHRETLAVSPAIVASIDITDIGAAAITPSTSSTRATSSVVRRLAWTVAWASDWKTRRSEELYATAPTKRSSRVVLTVFTKSSKKKRRPTATARSPNLSFDRQISRNQIIWTLMGATTAMSTPPSSRPATNVDSQVNVIQVHRVGERA